MLYGILRVTVVVLLFAIGFSCQEASGNKRNEGDYYRVTKVVDGDTFWASNGSGRDVKVRLIGLDAPETRKSERKDVGYYGEEAKEYLTELVLGEWVQLVSDVDSLDRYGRTLAYAYLEDGTFVNAELIKNGYAVILTIPPNVKHAVFFQKLQAEARKYKKGLWGK